VLVPKGGRPPPLSPLIPAHIETLVFIAAVNDATERALNYARSLHTEVRAIYFALDSQEIEEIQHGWQERGFGVELNIVEAPFRDLGPPILAEVRRITARPDSVAAVIVPEVVPEKWWHRILHNQRALFIKRLLLFEPSVILTSVPYQIR
jgi:hypothetical protein